MNSILVEIETDDLTSEARLTKNSPIGNNRTWVVVEGIDDEKLYKKFFKKDKVYLKTAQGITNIIDLVGSFYEANVQSIGIKDSDFDVIEGETHPSYIFSTDYHDAELMMLSYDSILENLFSEYIITASISDVRNCLLNDASFLGYTRWFNYKNVVKINFKGLGISSYYNNIGSFDETKCIDDLNIRSANKTQTLTVCEVKSFMTANQAVDKMQLCNGHDLCAMLSIYINNIFSGKNITCKVVEHDLRMSYTMDLFKNTNLYQNISDWSSVKGLDLLS